MNSLEQKALEIFQEAKQDTDLYSFFRERIITDEKISGRTLPEWKEHFRIEAPEAPDPQMCISIDMKIMSLHHEATFYCSLAKLILDSADDTGEVKFRSEYQNLYNKFQADESKRMPGAPILETLARATTSDFSKLASNAKRELEFWKRILADLDMKRRLIENATINNGILAKMEAKMHTNIPETPDLYL